MSTSLERKWYAAVASLENCVSCGEFGVQVSHSNQGRGMGQKAPPWETAALCPREHYEVDNGKEMSQLERRAFHDRMIVRTHSALIRAGKLKLV